MREVTDAQQIRINQLAGSAQCQMGVRYENFRQAHFERIGNRQRALKPTATQPRSSAGCSGLPRTSQSREWRDDGRHPDDA